MVITCTCRIHNGRKEVGRKSISHTEIKNVLVKHGIEWRNSKTVLGKSRDPECELKKIGLKS
ncbi:MAG TPA: hypothetical protein VLA48_08560 [Nitrososphaeraceae archaeon]|nr:hypothetical protein [Nitrososphaeraceae archaeon]